MPLHQGVRNELPKASAPTAACGSIACDNCERVHVPVVSAQQKERSAHSKKPTQFHFVCPMHEDVQSKTQGTCPKCKMKLVKRRAPKHPHGSHGG